MVTYIRQLLFHHNCVVVPGLGAFIANYQPARVIAQESKIYPPTKSIAFNRSLKQNDGLLIMQVARQEQIAYKTAEEQVMAFSRSCIEALDKHRSFLFKDIGRLYLDQENNLLFEPADTVNYLVEANSLPVLDLQPIERLKQGASLEDARPRIENDHDVEALLAGIEADQQKERTASRIPYWVSFVLVIGFLSTIVGVTVQQQDLSRISYSSFFPDLNALRLKPAAETRVKPQAEKTALPEIILPAQELPVQAAVEPIPVTEPAPEPVTVASSIVEIPKAYIVVGAFFDQQYADKAKAEAAEAGYRSVQIDDYNGALHRVMIESDIQRVDADLVAVKSTLNARAWVFCANCSY